MNIRAIGSDEESTLSAMDGFEIVADDGRALFYIRLNTEGVIEVSSGGSLARHGGKTLDSQIAVRPVGPSVVTVRRDDYRSEAA